MCSKYDNNSRLNSQLICGGLGGGGNGLYEHKNDHLTSTKIFTLLMNGIFIRALNIMRKVATASIWIC